MSSLTLDPDDWNELQRVGHRMMDDAVNYLRDVRQRPAWQAMPQDVRRKFPGRIRLELVNATSFRKETRGELIR